LETSGGSSTDLGLKTGECPVAVCDIVCHLSKNASFSAFFGPEQPAASIPAKSRTTPMTIAFQGFFLMMTPLPYSWIGISSVFLSPAFWWTATFTGEMLLTKYPSTSSGSPIPYSMPLMIAIRLPFTSRYPV